MTAPTPPPDPPAWGPPAWAPGPHESGPPPPGPPPAGAPALAPARVATGPAPPRVWSVFLAFGVVVGCVVTVPGVVIAVWVALQAGPHVLFDPATSKGAIEKVAFSFPGISLAVLLNALAIAGVALTAAALSPVAWRTRLRLGRPRFSWALVPVLVIGVLALSQALDALAVLLGISNHGFLPRLRQLVRSLPPGSLAVLAVIMGAAPGFCEEVFFRGYLQARLIERWGPAAAVATSAVLFGALHLDPVQAPMAAVLGLYLGHVAWRAESIWPAVVCHAVNNVVATLSGALVPEHLGGRVSCLVQLTVGVALAAASLALLHRGTPRSAVTS